MIGDAGLSDAKQALLQKMKRGAAPGLVREARVVTPRPPGAATPISPDQRQVWLHCQMAPDIPLYNESVTIHRRGAFDLAVLERSLNEILRRHEIWRTSFEMVEDDILQIVHPELTIALTLEDLTSLPASQRDAEAVRLATEDARRPIALDRAPLFRARVVRLAEDDHRLYLTLHHIIFDGVSIYKIVVPELSALYDAYAHGAASPLAEPALQYGDYAIWRREEAAGERVARQMTYWRRTLAGPLPKAALEGTRTRPPVPTYRGSMETFEVPLALTEALKAISRAERATLYMTLLAAFKAMLFRYSGQEDLLIGGATDLRRRPELEQVMGYSLNSMALRTRPAAGLTFRDYLAQVRLAVLGALDASEVPFDAVVRELAVRREPGAHPLFQVLFSVEPPVDPFPDGWDLTQMDVVVGGSKFDLYLELDERPTGLIGRFMYATDLFDAAAIRRMIGHWLTILDGVVADPGQTLARLPMLTAAETRRIVTDWNATDAATPASTLHQLFQAQARRTPDSIAVAFGDSAWTYGELDRRSDAVASRLRRSGVKAGDVVGVCMNRSLEMMAGLLGILKTGAAYLPLDPGFPQARLDFIVADARPSALLADPDLGDRLDAGGAPVVTFDTVGDDGLDDARSAAAPAGPGDLAYVLYTSGSTGRPKGVEVSHAAIVNLLTAMQREIDFTPRDSTLAVTTLSFDLSLFDLFLPLVSGGRCTIASREDGSDPHHLAALIERSQSTVMLATPSAWRALIEAGWSGRRGLRALACGEVLPRAQAEGLMARTDGLWNTYGPTETTVLSTLAKVTPGEGPVPIGRPIANTQIHILDPNGNTVPAGVVGELHIGGAGLARGYRNRPDLTAERFVDCAAAGGARVYRTGDLARYRDDGVIEYLGRIDGEEKIRGFRVAVEEIEAALARHPDIAAAAVRAWPDSSGARALAAYLVCREGETPAAPDLRRFLGETLPDYMIPSRFMPIGALPMTPNGKVDRKALPEPAESGLGSQLMPPEGQIEEALAAHWRAVLQVTAVGRCENFFDLGGHSLMATKLLRRIELDFGRRLTMAAFFQSPTIEAMARLLGRDAHPDLPTLIPIQPNGSRPPLLWIDGSVSYRLLSQAIDPDQPFLGVPIEAMLERNAASPIGMETAADMVVQTIREAQPKGPYYLGGWCDMGILAYAVASQLKREGQAVDLVMLVDSTDPITLKRLNRVSLILSQIRYHWPRFWRLGPRERLRYLAERIHGALVTRRGLRRAVVRDDYEILRDRFSRAVAAYQPPPYDGDVMLLQHTPRLDVLELAPGWAERIVGRFYAHDVPGTHATMREAPHVWEMGALMNAALLRAHNRGTEPATDLRAAA